MLSVNVTKQDNGLFNRLKSRAKSMVCRVELGYFDNKKHLSSKRPITVRQVASFHEFGTSRMPKRAFIRPALQQNRNKYVKIVGKQITPVLLGRQSVNGVWVLVGKEAVNDIQNYIVAGNFTPLSHRTAKRKGTRVPLIESGQMYDDVDYKVK